MSYQYKDGHRLNINGHLLGSNDRNSLPKGKNLERAGVVVCASYNKTFMFYGSEVCASKIRERKPIAFGIFPRAVERALDAYPADLYYMFRHKNGITHTCYVESGLHDKLTGLAREWISFLWKTFLAPYIPQDLTYGTYGYWGICEDWTWQRFLAPFQVIRMVWESPRAVSDILDGEYGVGDPNEILFKGIIDGSYLYQDHMLIPHPPDDMKKEYYVGVLMDHLDETIERLSGTANMNLFDIFPKYDWVAKEFVMEDPEDNWSWDVSEGIMYVGSRENEGGDAENEEEDY